MLHASLRRGLGRLSLGAAIPTGIVTIVVVLFLNNMAGASIRPLLPVYLERELGLPPAFSGTLIGVESLIGGVVSIVAGALADAVGHRLVLLIGFAGFTAGLMQFTAGAPWVLVVLGVVFGLSQGLRSTAGQSYVLNASRAGSVGVSTAAYFLGGTLGQAVGAALAGPLIEAGGFAFYALVAAGVNVLPIAIALRWLPRLPRAADAHRSLGPRAIWSVVRRRDLLLLGGLRFFPTAFWGTWSFVIPLLIFRASNSVVVTALYTTSGLVLSTISQFAVGRWSDRHGRATPTYLFLSGMVLAPALAAVWHSSAVGLFLTGIAGTACGWTMSVLVLGAVRQRTQASERGRAIGFIHMLWSFGFFMGSVTAGQFLDVNPAIPLGLAAFWNTLALAAAVALYRGRAARAAPVEASA